MPVRSAIQGKAGQLVVRHTCKKTPRLRQTKRRQTPRTEASNTDSFNSNARHDNLIKTFYRCVFCVAIKKSRQTRAQAKAETEKVTATEREEEILYTQKPFSCLSRVREDLLIWLSDVSMRMVSAKILFRLSLFACKYEQLSRKSNCCIVWKLQWFGHCFFTFLGSYRNATPVFHYGITARFKTWRRMSENIF